MPVEVITPGRLPAPEPIRGTCPRCGCVVAALRADCDVPGCVACPTAGCGRLIRIDGAGAEPKRTVSLRSDDDGRADPPFDYGAFYAAAERGPSLRRRRTRAEVLAARDPPLGGCCDRYADNKACGCLEAAAG